MKPKGSTEISLKGNFRWRRLNGDGSQEGVVEEELVNWLDLSEESELLLITGSGSRLWKFRLAAG